MDNCIFRCRCAVGILVIEVAFISLALFRSHWPKILYVRRKCPIRTPQCPTGPGRRTADIVMNGRRATRGPILLIGIVIVVGIGGTRFNERGSYIVSLCSDSAHTAIFRPSVHYLWCFSWAASWASLVCDSTRSREFENDEEERPTTTSTAI